MVCSINTHLKANCINLHFICSGEQKWRDKPASCSLCRAEDMLGRDYIMATASPKSRYNPSIKEF